MSKMTLQTLVDHLEDISLLYESKIILGKRIGTPMEKQILNQIRLTVEELIEKAQKFTQENKQ